MYSTKEKKGQYNKRYWKKYYLAHREEILSKNRTWAKSEKGKEYKREYYFRNKYYCNGIITDD